MKYEKYKDSGVEWIGEIPYHWKVKKLRTLGKFTSSGIDKKINEGEEIIKIINYTDIYGNESLELTNRDYMEVSATESQIQKHMVKKGDLIFTPSSETAEDIGISALVKDNLENTSFSYHVVRFHFCDDNEISFNYKKYLCNNHYVYNYFSSQARGTTRQTLNRKDFKDTIVYIPPFCEQIIIAKYLDDKTFQIDSIIKNLESEKEKLEVYKRELIAEVVTKGLNSNIPMKDSGVDWIGQVPEYWEVKKIKWIFKILKRQNGRDDRQVLSITQQGIKIKDIENNDGQMAESYENYQLVEPGDFAMNSMDLLTGWIDCSQYEGVTSPDYRVFRLIDINDHNNDFYNYLFQMCYTRRIFYRIGQGVSNLGRWRLQREPFLNMKVPVPPKAEQENISSFIRIKENKINVIVNEVEKQIEKLKEYRKILIHEAVTGKVKIDGGAK